MNISAKHLRKEELAKIISQKYDELNKLRSEIDLLEKERSALVIEIINKSIKDNEPKYYLREACDAIKEDVNNSPQWLKNIYEQNKAIRKFIEEN